VRQINAGHVCHPTGEELAVGMPGATCSVVDG
jgi:hypothetical protein